MLYFEFFWSGLDLIVSLFPAERAGCVVILISNHFRNIPVAIAAKADDGTDVGSSQKRDLPWKSLESFETDRYVKLSALIPAMETVVYPS